MTTSVHVEEIDQVHEYEYCNNANVIIIVKKDDNGVEKYLKYSEIVCGKIGHTIRVVAMTLNVKVCCVFYALHLFIILY